MHLPKFSKREKVLSAAVGGCFVLVAIGQYGFGLLDSLFNSTRQEIARVEQKVHEDKVFLAQQNDIQQRFKEMAERFGQKTSDQEWMAQTLSAVNTLTQAGKIQLQELNSGSIERKDGVHVFKMRASLKGDWPSLLEFFSTAQRPPYRFDFEEISLEKFPGDPDILRCQLTLSRWILAKDEP